MLPSKSCNRILICIGYDYLIPWFTIGGELFGRRPCTGIPAAPPCSWQAVFSVLACCMHLPIAIILTPALFWGERGGEGWTLSPLVGSTGPGHDHVCWPTNGDSIILLYYLNHGIYLCRGVGGWEKDWNIDYTSKFLSELL